ncbi:MAG: restriction endonuclease subunit S, partial [Sedimenticolaceae bacterium]
PKGWVWSSLGNLGGVIGGLTKNPKRRSLPKKLPYLRVANVYANELRLEEIEEIGVDDKELDKLLVRKGDLLIVEGNGSPDQIGRLAVWDGSISPCVHQNHLIKVRLSEDLVSEWILSWLTSVDGRHNIRIVASSTSGLYTLSVGKVSALPIPLPPVPEQRRIVTEVDRHLSLIRETESGVDTNLKRAERLRQSILTAAFAGHLCGLDTDGKPEPEHCFDMVAEPAVGYEGAP